MEQTFSVIVPNVKPNANGDWPQSAKRKAPRFEVPAGTDLVDTSFNLSLAERPGPGRIYIIGLMSGPAGGGLPIGSLCIGAEDQWLVTAHGGSEAKKDIQEDGDRRVIAKFSRSYFITLSWQKDSAIIYTIYEDQTKERVIQQIAVRSTLNLDSGGRILVDQDVKNPKRLKDLHSLPPFGSTITGIIKASDMDIDDPDDDSDEPISKPVDDPLPPISIPPVTQPPVIKPSQPVTTPPVTTTPTTTKPTNPNSSDDKVLGLDRTDLILILRSILSSFERGEDIDLRSILAQVLAPILLNELLNRR